MATTCRTMHSQTRAGAGTMIGHVTYLSDELMGQKFGRELRSGTFSQGEATPVEFQIESYLNYQGDKFSGGFDANSYILITKMLDYFDLSREYNHSPVEAFSHAKCNFLVISFSSDWRFSPQRSREITDALIGRVKMSPTPRLNRTWVTMLSCCPTDAMKRFLVITSAALQTSWRE